MTTGMTAVARLHSLKQPVSVFPFELFMDVFTSYCGLHCCGASEPGFCHGGPAVQRLLWPTGAPLRRPPKPPGTGRGGEGSASPVGE